MVNTKRGRWAGKPPETNRTMQMSLKLSKDEHAAIVDAARLFGVTQTEIIRRAVRFYVENVAPENGTHPKLQIQVIRAD